MCSNDLIPRPKKLPWITPLEIGTVCTIKFGYEVIKVKIVKVMFPGYKFMNTNPWILRYMFEDLRDSNHNYIISANAILKIDNHVNVRQKSSNFVPKRNNNRQKPSKMESRKIG